jgi:2-polyprenyl-3-methyl-5-hydroxy-6-metoxy-1,4-benzoquinol methylase
MNVMVPTPQTDAERLEAFAVKVVCDIGAAIGVLLTYMGDQTGLYRLMAERGPMTATALSQAAGVDERYQLEWLSAQAAAGYVEYDAAEDLFSLNPEQAAVLAQEGHPANVQGGVQLAVGQYATYEKALDIFRSGAGRPWGEHHACLFCGTDRFFRPGYAANLVESWIPALDGVQAKLEAGAKVADVGCGHGSSTVLMAAAFPRSTFHGVDMHGPSLEAAREKAEAAGVSVNTRFEQAGAADYAGTGFDLVCVFDALHDMGDPLGVARHIRASLKPDGTFMLVEPLAGDSLAENLNPVGQIFYAASTLICTPAGRAQGAARPLGAQAGEKRLTAILKEAGFSRVRRAAETMTNMVLEARP